MDKDQTNNEQASNDARFVNTFLMDSIESLQYLCSKRDLLVHEYTREQLESFERSELKMLRAHLHELLYAPPSK